MKNIANIITQILTYSDTTGTTDNPQLRNFDWNRRISSISIDNPDHGELRIPPGGNTILLDGLRSSGLDDTSELQVTSIANSVYKLAVTLGTLGGWRESRAITTTPPALPPALDTFDVNVTINNDSVATFEFVGAGIAIAGVQVGDIIRVAGESTYGAEPYLFTSVNSGLWSVIGISGVNLQAVRTTGEPFSGIDDQVVGADSTQIEIYSAAGVQAGDKFELKSPFSSASHKVFRVKDVTPTVIYFVSTSPIPEETINYPDPVPNGHSMVIYSSSKRVFYLETDQEVSIQFNNDQGDNVRVCPISPGNPDLIGYIHKFGPCYKVIVHNRSVNIAKILYFVAE